MKALKTNKLGRIMLCFALVISLVCAMGVLSSAAEEDVELAIGLTNLKYDAQTEILVTVDGDAPDGYTKGIAVWSYDVAGELTAANVSYTNFIADYIDVWNAEIEDFEQIEFFATKGLAAAELGEVITIAPAYVNDNDASDITVLVDKAVEKSLIGYVAERLAEDDLANYQIDLYRDFIVYGTAAEEVLGDKVANNAVVLVNGGYVGDRNLPVSVVDGETAYIRANAINAAGEYFYYWADAAGNKISGERNITVDVEAGLNSFTAVYTADASASAYAFFANFQQHETGLKQWTIAELNERVTAPGQVTLSLPLIQHADGSVKGWNAQMLYDPDALAGLADGSFIPEDAIFAADKLIIEENFDGVKYLNWMKSGDAFYTYSTNCPIKTRTHANQKEFTRYEIDLSVLQSSDESGKENFFYVAWIGEEGAPNLDWTFFRVYRTMYEGKDMLCVYDHSNQKVITYLDDNGGKNVVTLAFEVDAELGEYNIFVNGVKYLVKDGIRTGGYHCPVEVQLDSNAAVDANMKIYSLGFVNQSKLQ